MSNGYSKTLEKYLPIQDGIYEFVSNKWSRNIKKNVNISHIDDIAIDYVDKYWRNVKGNIYDIFPWEDIKKLSYSRPKGMGISIWSDAYLCGLAFSKPSKGIGNERSNITLRYMQGAAPVINPLKGYIAPIVFDCNFMYGKLLGKNMVYISDPLKGAQPLYVKIGFSFDKGHRNGSYMGRKI